MTDRPMTTPNTRPGEPAPASAGEPYAYAGSRPSRLLTYRDDGPIACLLGRTVQGRLPPLLPALAAAVITLLASVTGAGGPAGGHGASVLLVPVLVLLLAGPGSAHPHTGRLDWVAPNLIRVVEYGYLAAAGFSHGVPKPLVFALLCVLAYHHYDTAYRTRQGLCPSTWAVRAGLGWDGRMLLAGLGAATHTAPALYAVLTCYLGVLFVAETILFWRHAARRDGVEVDLEDDEDEAPIAVRPRS